ncbi:MAG: flagellar biosynthetic protein FliR [Deltaproteobacteria bacterium]|nr:flagellar biosynthetic protein FliR [Deltaproteobacteria bacterium]
MDFAVLFAKNYPAFLFVLVRTGSIIMAAPIFGAFSVPMRIKAGLSLVLAVLLTPLVPKAPVPVDLVSIAIAVGNEALIGAAIGLAARFIFTGIEYAGQIASFQIGIGMASTFDPIHGAQVTVIGRLMGILAILVFLSVNGHLMVIMAIRKSFDVIPPYGFNFSAGLMEDLVLFSKETFLLAVKFSAPVVAVMVFVNIALGIMARTVPQLNMFAIGFAATIAVGFIMLAFSMPVIAPAAAAAFDRMWAAIFGMMGVMGNA